MKKIFFHTLFCIFLFLNATFFRPSPSFALAEPSLRADSYACIRTDVYFYNAPDDRRGLFLLPRSYYVKILEYGERYCKIEYLYDDAHTKKLIGYAETALLTPVDYTPKRPYLYYVFDVCYRIGDTQIDDSAFLTQITVSCAYYGDYTIGSETYCYVLRNDSFGYIPKPDNLSPPTNTEYEEYLSSLLPSDASNDSVSEPSSSSPAQIAVLIAVCLLVPVLAALLLKPSKRRDYDAEDSFES